MIGIRESAEEIQEGDMFLDAATNEICIVKGVYKDYRTKEKVVIFILDESEYSIKLSELHEIVESIFPCTPPF